MPKLIRLDRVVEDDWVVLDAAATLADAARHEPVIVPLALWRTDHETLRARGPVGVWLAPADDPAALADDVADLPVIAVDFPSFNDGRGFSTARLLRDRYGYRGELRAIGDIFRDQLFFLAECGFDAFAVRPGLDPEQERAGLAVFHRTYTYSHRAARPWFRGGGTGAAGRGA